MTFIFFYNGNASKLQWEAVLQGRLGWTTTQGTCRFRVEGRSATDIIEVLKCLSDTAFKATVYIINDGEIRFDMN